MCFFPPFFVPPLRFPEHRVGLVALHAVVEGDLDRVLLGGGPRVGVGHAFHHIYIYKPWLRTDGVNTNGAAAKGMNLGRLGKKARPGTFGKVKVA